MNETVTMGYDRGGGGDETVVLWAEASDPTTWTVTGCTVIETRPRIPMMRVADDDEPDGFPWPYRTDGRANHWYWKAVDRVELAK